MYNMTGNSTKYYPCENLQSKGIRDSRFVRSISERICHGMTPESSRPQRHGMRLDFDLEWPTFRQLI